MDFAAAAAVLFTAVYAAFAAFAMRSGAFNSPVTGLVMMSCAILTGACATALIFWAAVLM